MKYKNKKDKHKIIAKGKHPSPQNKNKRTAGTTEKTSNINSTKTIASTESYIGHDNF
jgi:hypothetical protein